jgi:putative phosphoribosyl transferase
MKKFKDRQDAAKGLYDSLPIDQMKNENWNLVALSTGGLELAYHINKRLSLPIDILVSAAITAPQNPDCEIARVCETEEIVIHEVLCDSFDIQVDFVYAEASRKHEEKILPDIYKYRKGRHFDFKKDETVLVVDEGSETGLKLMVALKAILAQQPRAVYVCVPALPHEIFDAIEPLVDGIFYLKDIVNFKETSCYYERLEDVDDEMIEMIMKKENR